MLYSRIYRRLEESLRKSLRRGRVGDVKGLKRLIARTKPGSRLYRFMRDSCDASSTSGLADALLHPCVHTFRVEAFLNLVDSAGLQPLLFAHAGAYEDVEAEIDRLRHQETREKAPGNFIAYLGKKDQTPTSVSADSLLLLNPCLQGSVGSFRVGTLRILPRLGHPTPALGRAERAFLRRFVRPVPWDLLTSADRAKAREYLKALFLLRIGSPSS